MDESDDENAQLRHSGESDVASSDGDQSDTSTGRLDAVNEFMDSFADEASAATVAFDDRHPFGDTDGPGLTTDEMLDQQAVTGFEHDEPQMASRIDFEPAKESLIAADFGGVNPEPTQAPTVEQADVGDLPEEVHVMAADPDSAPHGPEDSGSTEETSEAFGTTRENNILLPASEEIQTEATLPAPAIAEPSSDIPQDVDRPTQMREEINIDTTQHGVDSTDHADAAHADAAPANVDITSAHVDQPETFEPTISADGPPTIPDDPKADDLHSDNPGSESGSDPEADLTQTGGGAETANERIKSTCQLMMGTTIITIRIKNVVKIRKEMKKRKTDMFRMQVDGMELVAYDMLHRTEKTPTLDGNQSIYLIVNLDRYCIVVQNVDFAKIIGYVAKSGKIVIDDYGIAITIRGKKVRAAKGGGGGFEDDNDDFKLSHNRVVGRSKRGEAHYLGGSELDDRLERFQNFLMVQETKISQEISNNMDDPKSADIHVPSMEMQSSEPRVLLAALKSHGLTTTVEAENRGITYLAELTADPSIRGDHIRVMFDLSILRKTEKEMREGSGNMYDIFASSET
jgi:hypothetical protein